MANDIDQNDKTPFPADRPDDTNSPEEVVRRLLESENGNTGPTQPNPCEKTSPPASDSQPDPANSISGRMTEATGRKLGGVIGRARNAVLCYRLTPRHMAVLLLSFIFLIIPWLIPVLALLGFFLLLVSYLTVGHERSGEWIAAWHGRLVRRNPDKAEVLRERAERASTRLSGWLQYLPKRWTVGLYLPDFARPDETSETLAGDPFDQLSKDST